MNEEWIIKLVSKKLRLIRHEHHYTQEKMARILGISKKTLVQIEKERMDAAWTCVIAVCTLFRDSDILQSALGADPLEVVETVAFGTVDRPKKKTMGGKVWWKPVMQEKGFLLQQNVISQHYRIIDAHHDRWFSTFDQKEALVYFQRLIKKQLSND